MSEQLNQKQQSAFFRHVILPSKTYKENHKFSEIKHIAKTYEKQKPLKTSEIDKFRNSCQHQLCIDMLCQGYHKSFREFRSIIEMDNNDEKRLENQPNKLRFLCKYLNKIEDAERRHQYSMMYRNYLELASFFLKDNDQWLTDIFHEKCLLLSQTYSQLDSQYAAEAHLNVGLIYKRKGNFTKALYYLEKYRELGENYYDLRIDANFQLTHFYMRLAEHQIDDQTLKYIIQAYQSSQKSDNKKLENEICFKLGQAYFEHNQVDLALIYFHKCYDYSRKLNDDEYFGRTSEALVNCYQKKNDIKTCKEYLIKYFEQVSHCNDDNQYGKACSASAFIDMTLGDYEAAIDYSSKAYSISLANIHRDLDRNRVLFGIAKGLKLRSSLDGHIIQMNINELLRWKCEMLERYLIKPKT